MSVLVYRAAGVQDAFGRAGGAGGEEEDARGFGGEGQGCVEGVVGYGREGGGVCGLALDCEGGDVGDLGGDFEGE